MNFYLSFNIRLCTIVQKKKDYVQNSTCIGDLLIKFKSGGRKVFNLTIVSLYCDNRGESLN